MSGALYRASALLLQGQMLPLAHLSLNVQQQGLYNCLQHGAGSTWSPLKGCTANVRQYAADAPEPMIIPAQRQQQNQPAVPAQRQELAVDLPSTNQGPWERVIDKTSGQPYWWNAKTGTSPEQVAGDACPSGCVGHHCSVHMCALWLHKQVSWLTACWCKLLSVCV
jgi:hypothetical protein